MLYLNDIENDFIPFESSANEDDLNKYFLNTIGCDLTYIENLIGPSTVWNERNHSRATPVTPISHPKLCHNVIH